MAKPQPSDPHGIIAHDIQENILIRDFSKQELKIIYLIIRLSWGCGLKVWRYHSYKDFEIIGLFKSDVAKNLDHLKKNKVIEWIERHNLLIFQKDYDLWTIAKKKEPYDMKKLVHESLKNANDVSELLTILAKNKHESSDNANGVSEKSERSRGLVNHERFETETPTENSVIGEPKESLLKKVFKDYSLEIENFRQRYSDFLNLIDDYFDILRTTRVSGKISNSVTSKVYQEMQKYPVIVVKYACLTVIRRPELHSKRENYFYGIMRNTPAEEAKEKLKKYEDEQSKQPRPNEEYQRLKGMLNGGSQ